MSKIVPSRVVKYTHKTNFNRKRRGGKPEGLCFDDSPELCQLRVVDDPRSFLNGREKKGEKKTSP